MLHATYKIVKGKSNKGNDFTALQFIIKTPVGDYKTGLQFPTPMEMAIIEKYTNNDGVKDGISAIYSGDTSPADEGF